MLISRDLDRFVFFDRAPVSVELDDGIIRRALDLIFQERPVGFQHHCLAVTVGNDRKARVGSKVFSGVLAGME